MLERRKPACDTAGRRWRAASYVRLSREDAAKGESESIASQRKLIDDWAEREGVPVVAHYADDGWSGATFDRPGFRQMIDDARTGRFDTIVVKDLSRFGRSYLDCGSWIERDLPKLGVRLYSIADDFDSMKAWDYNMALLLPMKNLMNELLVVTTSEKVRTSLAAKRARGECVANFAPYGYEKDGADPHKLVIDESAAEVVRQIFAWRLEGRSAREIARMLDGREVPCPAEYRRQRESNYRNGFPERERPCWHAKTVLRILRNEAYIGTLVQGKTMRPSWRMKVDVPMPRESWTRVAGAHEPIVSKEDFDAVAALIGAAPVAAKHGGDNLPVPFLDRLYCSGCGGRMSRMSVKSAGRRYVYYICSSHRKNPRVCSPHSIREESLLAQVEGLEAKTRLEVRADGRVTRAREA